MHVPAGAAAAGQPRGLFPPTILPRWSAGCSSVQKNGSQPGEQTRIRCTRSHARCDSSTRAESLGLKSQVPHLRGMLLQQLRNSCRPGGKALASSTQQL